MGLLDVSGEAGVNPYEGELVDNFACKIGDHVVVGQLSGMHLVENGDTFKAVVSRRHIPKKGEVLYAHALLRPKDELLWLPYATNKGRRVEFKNQMKMAFFSVHSVPCFSRSFPFCMTLAMMESSTFLYF